MKRGACFARSDAAVALIGLVLLLAWDCTGLDLVLTRVYGNAAGFVWRDAWLTSALLHDGGRVLACGVLALLAIDARQTLVDGPPPRERWFWLGVTLLCLLLVPTLKRVTNSSCPWELAEFGGAAAYVPHWLLGVRDDGPGHCFPSGHAVTAFAFLAPYLGWRSERPVLARAWLIGVCAAGLAFAWAQLARGAHFASHSAWSAWLCWLVCAGAARWRMLVRTHEKRVSV